MTITDQISYIEEHEDILMDFHARNVAAHDDPDLFDSWIVNSDDEYLTAIIQAEFAKKQL